MQYVSDYVKLALENITFLVKTPCTHSASRDARLIWVLNMLYIVDTIFMNISERVPYHI